MPGTRVLKDGCSFWPKNQCSGLTWRKWGCSRAAGLSVEGEGSWCMRNWGAHPGPAASASWDSPCLQSYWRSQVTHLLEKVGNQVLLSFPIRDWHEGRCRASCGAGPCSPLSDLGSVKVQAPQNQRCMLGYPGVPSQDAGESWRLCWGPTLPGILTFSITSTVGTDEVSCSF